jgi:dihydroxyacetone kinase-like protein
VGPRKLINNPADVVAEALEGFELAHSTLVRWNRDPQYVQRAHLARTNKVALVSGGGSGHEPLHTGFVGVGMLDAAVPGAVFASPTADQIAAATTAVTREAGAVHIVKNYTGDVLNFQLAAEMAAETGLKVESILVDDDLATDFADSNGPGRRGTAAVVTVEKICGAAAERGATLSQVTTMGRALVARSRTMAFALAACTHPDQDQPSFLLDDGEVEMGVGIHGEHGRERVPLAPADELVAGVLDSLVESLSLGHGDSVIAIVNGLGATHALELYIGCRALCGQLSARGIQVARSLVGPYVTALDMAGCSITLVDIGGDAEILELWDDPVRTPALTW